MPDLQQDQLPPIQDPANIDQVRAEQPAPRTLDNVADTIAEDFPEQEIQPNLLAPQPVSPEQSLQRKAADAMTAMQNVVLYGQSTDSKNWIDEHPEYKDFLDPDLIKDGGGDYLIGSELAEQCNSGDVFGILYNILDNEKDETRKQELATQIKSCNTADGKRLLGKLFREGVQENWKARGEYMRYCLLKQKFDKQNAEAQQAQLEQQEAQQAQQQFLNPEGNISDEGYTLIDKVVDSGLHQISREDAEIMSKAGFLNAAMSANKAVLTYLETRDSRDAKANIGLDVATAGEIGDIISSSENPALTRHFFTRALQRIEGQAIESEGRESVAGHAARAFARDATYFTQDYFPDKYMASAYNEGRSVNSSYFDDRADVLSLIRNTRAAAQHAQMPESPSWSDTFYNIGIAAGDMAPYFVPGFMPLALARHNRETWQDNVSTLMDDGVLTDAERSDASINASTSTLANAAAMFGTIKAFKYAGAKILPAPIARVSQYRLGAFAVNTAEQTANFGIALPAAEGALNWALEAATVQDERVRKGKQELAELISNMGDGEYWLTNIGLASIGALMHNTGNVAAARKRLEDRAFGRIAGLTEEQLDSTETLPPTERAVKRHQFMQENRRKDAPASILRSIEAIKASAEKYQAAQARRDNATIAALQLQGFHVEPSAEQGKVDLYYDGKVDENGNFDKGEKKITLSAEDANAYLNGVVAENSKGFIGKLRTAAANGRIMDAIKDLRGKIILETLRSPEIVSRVQEKAKAAEQRKKERTQQLMDEAKKNLKTLSLNDAERKAGKEVHDDIAKGETLDDIISFGEQMKQRMEIDKARGVDTENTASRAYVVSRTNLDTNSVERVFKIATNATTREVVEEYGEQLRKDWMDAQDISALQAYRMLADLQAHFGDKANFLTLSKRNATLHEKATDTRFDEGSFTDAERATIDREVTEALSKLLMSDLLQQVQSGRTAIPAWARTLFDGSNLVETEMQNEMALGSALAQARQEGWMPELMKNLLGVAPDAVAKALEAKAAPQPQEYRNAYMDALQRQFELDARYGAGRTTDPELIEREYNTAVEGQRAADEQAAAQEAEAAQPAAEIVKEVEQEQGLSHEEAVKATADSYNAEQETRTAESPAAIQDSAFSNGVCMEITDAKGGLLCKFGTIAVDNLKIMPNFKIGADVDTGVVRDKNLTGDYRPDHDPIRVFRDKDGTLWVISGRHRLAKCKEAGVDKISVYLYDESPALNMEWAHKFDIESNIRDDQASVMECALYMRGKLYKGGHELTEQEAEQASLTRKETKAYIGYEIGKYASDSLINAVRDGVMDADGEHREIDPKEAHRIALVAPRNEQAQLLALDLLAAGQSWTTIHKSMLRELRRQKIAPAGGAQQLDMFGMLDTAESRLYDAFFSDYEIKKVKAINEELSYLNQVAGGGSVKRNAKYDVNVKSPEDLKARITELKVLKDQWKSADLYPELKAEVDQAFYNQGNLFSAETKARIDARKAEAEKQPAAKDNPGQSTFNFSTTSGLKELEDIKTLAMSNGTFMKAPNGADTNLTERQWLQVRTQAFKDWFGDWENDPAHASKVLDENGEPLVVYHGTPKGGFKEFKEESYFTPHRAYAERYVHAGGKGNIWGVSEGAPAMYELFLNIRKSFDTRTKADAAIFEREFLGKWGNNTPLSERGLPDWTDAADMLEFLEERGGGYDGVIIDEGGDPDANGNPVWRGVSYLTTSPTQIKSATENRGTFDSDNPRIDMSTTAGLKESENPVDDLGRVGSRFAGPLNRNFQPTGFEAVDERLQRMLNSVRSEAIRMTTVGSEKSGSAGVKLYMEAVGIINSVTPLLPQQYRFSLEPYKTFFNVYSVLHETGNPQDAADAVPMDGWDERMLSSFVKSFKRLYKDRDLMRDGFWKDVPNAEDIISKLEALPKRTSMKKAMQTEAGRELFKAMGNMRAQRLMQHYLERVQKQLDSFRKDSIRGRILRAVASLKPATKQGKPAKGRIAPDALRTVNTRMRLLQLTRGQQQDVMEQYAKEDANGISEWDKLPDTAEIKVRTFNEEGEEITLTTTKQDFELYSCFDAMDAAEADAAARALGSFIQDGKDYWEVMNDRARQRIAEVCDPMIAAATPGYRNPVKELSKRRNRIRRPKGQRIIGWIGNLMNDVQFIHAIAQEGDIGKRFARYERELAHTHVLIEYGERQTHDETVRILDEVTGTTGLKERQKRKEWSKFHDDINAITNSGIRLKPQSPDFERREAETLRAQLLTRLNFVTERKQNYDPDVVAKAISNLNARADLIPAEVLEEVNAKYGSIGSVEAYEAKYQKAKGTKKQALEEAVENVFGTSRFEHLKNFNQAVKDRAAKARAKWQETHKLEGESDPLDLTKNIAAYRVLIWEQEQYRDSMRQQGYTEEVIQQLRDFAGEQMMQYAYKLRDSLNARTDDIAAVYEQIYGMPFPKVENYFRAFFHTNGSNDTASALEADAGNAANAGSLSILKHRVQHNAPIEPLMSVTHAYANGRKQQDLLLAYSTPEYYIPKELTAFINYRKAGEPNAPGMRDVLERMLGPDLAILEEHIKAMTRLSPEADVLSLQLSRAMSLWSNTSAVNILNWRVGSLVKQATAVFNSIGSDEVGIMEWNKAMVRALFGRTVISSKQMAQKLALSTRLKGKYFGTDMARFNANEGVLSSRGATSALSMSGMYAMEWLDYKANIGSSKILYDAVYRKLRKQNPEWSHELLDAAATEAVETSLANKAQPLDFRSRPAMSLRRDLFRTASLFLGGETINTFGRVFSLAARGQLGKAAALWLYQGAMLQALTFVWNFLTDDKEQWQKRSIAGYLAGTIFGPLSGIPFWGAAVNKYGIEPLRRNKELSWLPYMNGAEILPAFNLERVYRDWEKAESSLDYAIAAENTLRIAASGAAMAAHNPGSKSTAYLKAGAIFAAGTANLIDFLLRAYRAQSEEGLITRAQQAPETLLTTTPKKKSTRRRAPSARRAPSRRTAP